MTDPGTSIQSGQALAVIFGPPSPVTTAMAEVLQAIAQSVLGSCAIPAINTMQEWEAASTSGYFIAISHFPAPEFCSYMECSPDPVIVVADDPLRSVGHLIDDQESEIATVRAVSASFACLAAMLARSEPDIQMSNLRNLQAFVGSLARTGVVDPATLIRIQFQATDLVNRLTSVSKFRINTQLSKNGNGSLAELVLPRLSDLRIGRNGLRLRWPSHIFLLADLPGTSFDGPVELAGPGRCLLYGPYLHLPSGQWTAFITVDLASHEDEQSFTVEMVCKDVIAKGRIFPQGATSVKVQIDFEHRSPHVPLELRIILDAGTIDGAINHLEVSLIRADRRSSIRLVS